MTIVVFVLQGKVQVVSDNDGPVAWESIVDARRWIESAEKSGHPIASADVVWCLDCIDGCTY